MPKFTAIIILVLSWCHYNNVLNVGISTRTLVSIVEVWSTVKAVYSKLMTETFHLNTWSSRASEQNKQQVRRKMEN